MKVVTYVSWYEATWQVFRLQECFEAPQIPLAILEAQLVHLQNYVASDTVKRSAYPTVSGGEPSRSSGFMRTMGMIIIGGMYTPVAKIQATTVTFFPLSAQVLAPSPFLALWHKPGKALSLTSKIHNQ